MQLEKGAQSGARAADRAAGRRLRRLRGHWRHPSHALAALPCSRTPFHAKRADSACDTLIDPRLPLTPPTPRLDSTHQRLTLIA
eukprot:6180352-Pleurochrysis_carterae.AAC.2